MSDEPFEDILNYHLNNPPTGVLIRFVLRDGNTEAFDMIWTRYYRRLHSFASSKISNDHDIEEIAHKTYIAAFENLQQLENPDKFYPWLCGIASNKISDYYRKKRAEKKLRDKYALINTVPGNAEEAFGKIANVFEDDTQRKIAKLRLVYGKTLKEIAEKFGLKPTEAWQAVNTIEKLVCNKYELDHKKQKLIRKRYYTREKARRKQNKSQDNSITLDTNNDTDDKE